MSIFYELLVNLQKGKAIVEMRDWTNAYTVFESLIPTTLCKFTIGMQEA